MADIDNAVMAAVNAAESEGTIDTSGMSDSVEDVVVDTGDDTPADDDTAEGDTVVKGDGTPEAKVEKPAEEKPVVTDAKAKAPKDSIEERIGPEKDKNGRENRLPHSRVRAIVAKSDRDFMDTVGPALGVQVTEGMTREAFTTAASDALKDVPRLRERDAAMEKLAPIMENNEDDFIRILAMTNPKYKKFVDFIEGGGTAEPAKAAVPEAKDDPRPEPDLDMGDGRKTYSTKGFADYEAWKDRQADRKIAAAIDGVRGEIKPIVEERKTAKERADHQVAQRQQLEDIMNDAVTWEGFKENEPEILKAMKEDPSISKIKAFERRLGAAYRKVVWNKLATDRQRVREEFIAEQAAAPASTSTGATKRATTSTKGKGAAAAVMAAVDAAGLS
jgi:hypothetical protein